MCTFQVGANEKNTVKCQCAWIKHRSHDGHLWPSLKTLFRILKSGRRLSDTMCHYLWSGTPRDFQILRPPEIPECSRYLSVNWFEPLLNMFSWSSGYSIRLALGQSVVQRLYYRLEGLFPRLSYHLQQKYDLKTNHCTYKWISSIFLQVHFTSSLPGL